MYSVSLSDKLAPSNENVNWSNDPKIDQIINFIMKWGIIVVAENWKRNNLEDTYRWCKLNCANIFGFTMENKWYFLNESDSIQFALRWK